MSMKRASGDVAATDRFSDTAFKMSTMGEVNAKRKQVAKEQKAAVAKSLAPKTPAPPVEASGGIWLL